jgi:SAM-dependent methyltransferase
MKIFENYPDLILNRILPKNDEAVILDIGAGQGRNSIYLAKKGYNIEAVDILPENIIAIKKKAEKLGLRRLLAVEYDIRNFKFKMNRYALIIAVCSLDFMRYSEIVKVILRMKSSLKKGGYIYMVCFTKDDPIYQKFLNKSHEIDKDTFFSEKTETYRHFFAKGELESLVSDLKIIYKKEFLKIDNKPAKHKHGLVRIIAKKVD